MTGDDLDLPQEFGGFEGHTTIAVGFEDLVAPLNPNP